MASPINNYQASALAARLAATYLTNQNNVNAPANAGEAKPATDAPATNANGASGGSSPANSDGVILSLSDEAKQLLASLQQGLQQGLQPNNQPNNQPTSLAAFLNASGQNDDQQNDLLSAYSGAIKQFQQWLSQPPQPKTAPASAPADTAPAKAAADADSSAAPSGDTASSDSGTSGSDRSGGGVAS